MTRLKAFVSNPVERPPADTPLPYVALEHIESGTGRLLPSVELDEVTDDTAVVHQAGDVRFGKLRPYLAKSLYMAEDGQGSGELLVLRPRSGLNARFLYYLTLSQPFVEWATATAYGVKMPRTNFEALGAFQLDPPPIVEQQRITDYLDLEIARLDVLIDEEMNLARLIHERVDALRESAFSGGRPRRLKEVLREWPTYGVLVPEFVEEGVPFVRVGDLDSMAEPSVPERRIPNELSAQYRRTILRGGEVLVSVVGSLGRVGVAPERLAGANVARAVAVLQVDEERCPATLLAEYVQTRCYQDQALLATGSDTAQPTLNMIDLANFVVPLPDHPNALAELTATLERERAKAALSEAELGHRITLLRERRQALITHAVTHGIEGLPGVA